MSIVTCSDLSIKINYPIALFLYVHKYCLFGKYLFLFVANLSSFIYFIDSISYKKINKEAIYKNSCNNGCIF